MSFDRLYLEPELLTIIIKKIDSKEIKTLSQVNKSLHQICSNIFPHRGHCIGTVPMYYSDGQFTEYCKLCGKNWCGGFHLPLEI